MKLEERLAEFQAAVNVEEDITVAADGFGFTEGPIWNPEEQALVFSDLCHDRLVRWSERDGATTFRTPSNKSNGNAWDRKGGIVSCEHATSRVSHLAPDGTYRVLVSRFDGREFNSPNDVVVGHDGRIYFTDPIFGRIREDIGLLRPIAQPFRGLYCLYPDGEVRLLADDFAQPNGLCLSLNERHLFVNDTHRFHIRVFSLNADGSVSGGDIWADTVDAEGSMPDGRRSHTAPGIKPDGMKFDNAGHLYCTGPGGIHVFDGKARCLGVIGVPQFPTNFAFGDADLKSLYITAGTAVYRVRLNVPGICLYR